MKDITVQIKLGTQNSQIKVILINYSRLIINSRLNFEVLNVHDQK
jgi:hypothetical protein